MERVSSIKLGDLMREISSSCKCTRGSRYTLHNLSITVMGLSLIKDICKKNEKNQSNKI